LRAMYQDINNDDDVKSFLFHVQKEQEKRQGSTVYMTALEKERAQQRKKSIMKLRNSILEQSESPKKIRAARAALQGSPYSSPVQVQRKVPGGGMGGGVTPGRKRSGPGPGIKGEEIRHPSRT
jgi:hypothetical protein